MERSDILQIITESINSFLTETFQKEKEDILISDLLLVETLTIDGKDIDNNKIFVSFQDLKTFKNLRYLEISNTLITLSTINILSNLTYLENIVFRNCTFSKQIKNMSKLTNIRSIRIINCSNFNLSFIKKLTNIRRLYIALMDINGFSDLISLNLYSLDISESIMYTIDDLDKLNIKFLVISSEQYLKFKKDFLKTDLKIMVMADKKYGYYIDKWIN